MFANAAGTEVEMMTLVMGELSAVIFPGQSRKLLLGKQWITVEMVLMGGTVVKSVVSASVALHSMQLF